MGIINIPMLVAAPTMQSGIDAVGFILERAEREYTPILDTEGQPPERLLIQWVWAMTWIRVGVSRILNARGRLTPSWSSVVAEEIAKLSRITLDENGIEKARDLFRCYPDFRPLKALVSLEMEHKRIAREIQNRHEKHKTGMALVAMYENKWRARNPQDTREHYRPFMKRYGTGASFFSGDPQKDDDEDIGGIGMIGAVEFYEGRHKTIAPPELDQIEITPELPAEWGFPQAGHPWWEPYTRRVGQQVVSDLFRDYLPLFRGGVDRVEEASRQEINNYFDAKRTQKRGPSGDEKAGEDMASLPSAVDEAARLEAAGDLALLKLQARRLAASAKNPEKVETVLVAMLESGRRQADAARMTGIPQQTVNDIWYKYLPDLLPPKSAK